VRIVISVTLVIARYSALGLRILSDLRVSHPEERRNGLPHGVLKAVVINRDVCACFSGSVGLGAPAIAELAREGTAITVEAAVAALHEAHQRNVGGSEFLVARCDPPQIWKIANGRVAGNEPAAWIGDYQAFARFQALYTGDPLSFQLPPEFDPDGHLRDATQLMDAFRLVVADPALDTVGDARVVVKGEEEGFAYLPYLELDNGLDPPAITAEAGQEVSLIQVGSAAIGAFAYSVLVPTARGIGLVAVHVHQASLGFVYYPAASEDAIIYRSVTQPQFIERVAADWGLEITGFGIQASH
jgi:hypothetical protein